MSGVIDFTPVHEFRIANASFSCTVGASNMQEMGEAAWEKCRAYFGEQEFVIESLDADAIQTNGLETLGYTARVHARVK